MSEKTLWLLIAIVGGIGVCVLGFALWKLRDLMRSKEPSYECPQLRFGKISQTENETVQMLQKRFDTLLPFFLVELLLVLLCVNHNVAQWLLMQKVLNVLSVAFSALGLLERAARSKEALRRASNQAKWVVAVLWTIGLFACLVTRGARL